MHQPSSAKCPFREAICPTGWWRVAQPAHQPLSAESPHHMMPNRCSQLPATLDTSVQVEQPRIHQRSRHCTVCSVLDSSLSGWYIAYFHLRAVASAGVTGALTRKPSGHIPSPKSPAWGPIGQNSKIRLSCIKNTYIVSKLILQKSALVTVL